MKRLSGTRTLKFFSFLSFFTLLQGMEPKATWSQKGGIQAFCVVGPKTYIEKLFPTYTLKPSQLQRDLPQASKLFSSLFYQQQHRKVVDTENTEIDTNQPIECIFPSIEQIAMFDSYRQFIKEATHVSYNHNEKQQKYVDATTGDACVVIQKGLTGIGIEQHSFIYIPGKLGIRLHLKV